MDDVASLFPSRDELHQWTQALEDRTSSEADVEGLVALLGELRRAGRDLNWIADWVLMLAREHGASLPDLAESWSKAGRRELVHGPDARLARLSDRHGDAAAVLEAFLRLPVPDRPGAE